MIMLVVQVEMLKSITLVCVQYVYVQNHTFGTLSTCFVHEYMFLHC